MLRIECVVEEGGNSDDQTIFGKIAIWAGGFVLGNRSLTVILNTPLSYFKESLNDCGQRRNAVFNTMNAQEVWEFLYSVLYGDESDLEIDEELDLEKKYRKFCICPGFSESFDGEMAFLVEDDEGERFIWKDLQSQEIKEIRLKPETYKNVVESWVTGIKNKS